MTMTGTPPVGTPVPAPTPGGSGGNVPPAPQPPVTPQQLFMQQAMLQQLGVQVQNPNQQGGGTISTADAFRLMQAGMQAVSQSPAKQPPPPPPGPPPLADPRFGGQDADGAWAGGGKLLEGKKPKSSVCYREYKFKDRAKAIDMKNKNEKEIKKGLSDESFHFTMPLEATKNQTPFQDKLRHFETFAIERGIEGSFYIKAHSGATINMFQEPGKLTDAIVETWCEDLTKGVMTGRQLDGSLIRRKPCEYDETNNELSAAALQASSSLAMLKEIQRQAKGTLEVGPYILWIIISNNEVSSSSVIRDLCHELKKLDIKTIPGENLSTFSALALDKVEQIRARSTDKEPDDLTQLSLHGCAYGSDEGIRAEARKLIAQANKPGSTLTPEEALKTMVNSYNNAVASDLYAPLKAKPGSALQADTSNSNPNQFCEPTGSTSAPALDPQMLAPIAAYTAGTLQRTSDTYQGIRRNCHRCGRPGHEARRCTATVEEMLSSGGNHSSGGSQSSGGNPSSGRSNQGGLSEEESKLVNKLINDFQLPAF